MNKIKKFCEEISNVKLNSVFNPYSDKCDTYDLFNAALIRRKNLESFLSVVADRGTETIWMGRDLGYRGGRRTGLALTDESNIQTFSSVYSGAVIKRATKGDIYSERTATEVWAILERLEEPPFLWNVFPLHPHEENNQFSNRKFRKKELDIVNEINLSLINFLNIKRIVAIGQDAASYSKKLGVKFEYVRHPSFGGTNDFREGVKLIYRDQLKDLTPAQISFLC